MLLYKIRYNISQSSKRVHDRNHDILLQTGKKIPTGFGSSVLKNVTCNGQKDKPRHTCVVICNTILTH